MQQLMTPQTQSVFGVKLPVQQQTPLESPAFGVSSNNINETKKVEKEPVLIEKIPNLADDKSIKQPVAVKPQPPSPALGAPSLFSAP